MTPDSPQEQRPALSAEEWAEWQASGEIDLPIFAALQHGGADPGALQLDARNEGRIANEERHVIAALCLHQQPFGFSREDVTLLRDLADMTVRHAMHQSERDDLHALADRIAALLPPSQTPG